MNKQCEIKLQLPIKNEDKTEFVTFMTGTPIVLIGKNGAGKTRFASYIEAINDRYYEQMFVNKRNISVTRLSAQRNLRISKEIIQKDTESARNEVFWGCGFNSKLIVYQNEPSTYLQADYDYVLSYILSVSNEQLNKYHADGYKKYIVDNTYQFKPMQRLVDKVCELWHEILPHRKISFDAGKVFASADANVYHGRDMSDGERSILYMIARVILLDKNSVIIIDEPELHIHKSVLRKLWDKLEGLRQDCLFIVPYWEGQNPQL